MKKTISFVLLTVILTVSLGAVVSGAPKSKGTIYAIFKDSSSVFFADMAKGAKKACNELGLKLIVQNPASESEIDKQISLVEDAISARPLGIIVSCIAMEPLTDVLQQVKKKGIPLTCCDAGDAGKSYDALYATDCYKAAAVLCDKTAELMGGKGKIFLINAVAGAQSCMDRENGFRDCAKQKWPNIEIINKALFCDNDKTKAANQTLDMLTSTGGRIDAIVGLNENALIGAATAVVERGLGGKVIVTGVDASDDVCAYIKDGVIQASSIQNPFAMGYKAVYGIMDVKKGKKLGHAFVDTGSAIVTKENMNKPEIQAILKPKG